MSLTDQQKFELFKQLQDKKSLLSQLETSYNQEITEEHERSSSIMDGIKSTFIPNIDALKKEISDLESQII